jgi:hypothetical protein
MFRLSLAHCLMPIPSTGKPSFPWSYLPVAIVGSLPLHLVRFPIVDVWTVIYTSLSLPSLIGHPTFLSSHNPQLGRSMAGLQRSSQTFRRSASSGLVWDERLMSEEGRQMDQRALGEPEDGAVESKKLRHSRSALSIGLLQCRHNDGAEHRRGKNSNLQGFHTRSVTPALDPPSPKVPGCIFCGIFRKAGDSEPSKPRRYRVSVHLEPAISLCLLHTNVR